MGRLPLTEQKKGASTPKPLSKLSYRQALARRRSPDPNNEKVKTLEKRVEILENLLKEKNG